jgi:thiamine kinase-like enzyme
MKLKQLKNLSLFKNDKPQSLELLNNQGFCNRNYLLLTKKKSYLLREFGIKYTDNISRKYEYTVQNKAFKKGIAAQPLYFDDKYMICEYLRGEHKYSLNTKELKELARKIKKLHAIKSDAKIYDFNNDITMYEKNLKDKKSQKILKGFKKELRVIKSYAKEIVTTHHDLNPKNILFRNNKIKFIDWEYAGTNDKFFDLASTCFEFKLSKSDEEILLKTYLKKVNKNDYKKLKSYKRIYKFLYQLWFKNLTTKTKEN